MKTTEDRAKKAEERMRAMREKITQAQSLKAQGKNNREIAAEMGISESWVYQLLKNRTAGTATAKTAEQIAADLETQGKKLLGFAALLRGDKS